MKQKLLIVLAFILIGITSKVQAYSFSAVAPSGQTLYYNIKTTNTVEVSSQLTSSPYYNTKPTGALTIPDSVTNNGTTYSVTSIRYYAFYDCSGLTSVTIPNSVTSIGNYAFYYCNNLASVIIGSSVNSIGNHSFLNCHNLTSITIPNSVISIGYASFYSCFGLTSVTIGDSVKSIGGETFSHCDGLTSISIPKSVTSIGIRMFVHSSGLQNINVDSANTKYCSINGVLYDKKLDTLICHPAGKVGNYVIPDSISTIANGAFYGCSGLPSITIPNSVTSIGIEAFSYCSGLTSVIIGNSVKSIEDYAFYNCIGLTSITSKAKNHPNIQNYTFRNVNKYIPIYVPCASKSNYQTASGWSSFTNFIDSSYSIIHYDTICKGQNYYYYGFNFIADTTGLYTQNLQTINGCDSIIKLDLTVNPIYSTTYIDTICQGQLYNNYGYNFIADTSGLYIHKLQNTMGCDSVIKLNLSVNPIYDDTIIANICQGQSYNQNGYNENNTGIYTQHLQTINGCDSIVTLNLTVNQNYRDTIPTSICQGQVYNNYGFNFIADTTGIYTQNLQTISGCDSIITLNIIVNPNYHDTITSNICQGQIYNQYGFNADSTGIYTQHLQTINGCDSIITLNLTVNPIYSIIYNDSICQGQTYNNYGFNFIADTTGIYTQNLQTINGCDSIITLNLTVNPSPNTPSLLVERKHSYLEISWDSVGESYEVYRDDSLIATTSQAIYQDTNVLTDSSYCYKVKAFIGDCESDFSDISCMKFVGLNDINLNSQNINLYPNPTNGKAKLSILSLNDKAQVIIFDLTGRVLKTYIIDTNQKELEIDLSGFAKGVYNISIKNNNTNISKKLIIQ